MRLSMKIKMLIAAAVLAVSFHAGAALNEMRPLSDSDALQPDERATEVFSGEQWAMYQITRTDGSCVGLALANRDTHYYMRVESKAQPRCQNTEVNLAYEGNNDYTISAKEQGVQLVELALSRQ